MYDETAVAPAEAEAEREAIHAFMTQRYPLTACFLTTLRRDGRPSVRQVAAHLEGWTVGTVSQATHLKNLHIRRNPVVTYLWVSLVPTGHLSTTNVMLQGTCEVVEDPDEVQAFLERRSVARGTPIPAREYDRVLLRTTPNLLRAEGFTGPRRPAILTTF